MLAVEHIFEHLLGQFVLPWVKLKQNSKMCGHRHFSKYFSNNSRTPSNHHKNYAKTLFYSIILHSYFQSHSLHESIFKWIKDHTCAVEVWLNKSATKNLFQSFNRNLFFLHQNFKFEVIFVHTCIYVNSRVRHTS